jgi:hypothetical protein
MPQPDDLSRSLPPFVQGNTLVAVIELSLSSWLITGLLPGVARQPLKKLDPDEAGLLRLLHRWQDEAVRNGSKIDRIVVAYEAGRDGSWLAPGYRRKTPSTALTISVRCCVDSQNDDRSAVSTARATSPPPRPRLQRQTLHQIRDQRRFVVRSEIATTALTAPLPMAPGCRSSHGSIRH